MPFLQAFIDANPITADYDKVWERSLPLSAYQGQDDVKGEGKVVGLDDAPSRIRSPSPAARPMRPTTRAGSGRRSPTSTSAGWRRRRSMRLKLGRGAATDFLGVSFSALDGVGHVYGPRSHEVQDVLVRLDRTIGTLLDHLDATVGAGNYVLGLSADHGVSEIPEQIGGGRVVEQGRQRRRSQRCSSPRSDPARTCCRRPTRTST